MGIEVWAVVAYVGYLAVVWVWDWIRFRPAGPGETVLITGGCQGIGKELALIYAKTRCKVVIWDVAEHLFLEVSSEIKSRGGLPFVFKCDISQRESVRSAAKATLQQLGKVDIVVNNAGIFNNYEFADLPDEKLEKVFGVNFFGHAWVTKEFYHSAKQFVTVASVLSKVSADRAADYCASKHALDGLFNGIRMDVKRKGKNLKFTTVYPSHIKTQLFSGFKSHLSFLSLEPRDVAEAIYKATCLGKEEIYLPFYAWHINALISFFPSSVRDSFYLALSKGSLDNVKQS